MHEDRIRLKNAGMRIEKTIKGLICIAYGNSIKTQKKFKNIYSDNIQNTINNHGTHVVKYNDKYVTIMRDISPHFYHPQYAKRLLDNYHEKMKRIGELVDILYCNIDSILVTESDYLKLEELGYIDDNAFGKFRVEHIFTRFAIKDCKNWIGICENGKVIKRPKKSNRNFEEFANTL